MYAHCGKYASGVSWRLLHVCCLGMHRQSALGKKQTARCIQNQMDVRMNCVHSYKCSHMYTYRILIHVSNAQVSIDVSVCLLGERKGICKPSLEQKACQPQHQSTEVVELFCKRKPGSLSHHGLKLQSLQGSTMEHRPVLTMAATGSPRHQCQPAASACKRAITCNMATRRFGPGLTQKNLPKSPTTAPRLDWLNSTEGNCRAPVWPKHSNQTVSWRLLTARLAMRMACFVACRADMLVRFFTGTCRTRAMSSGARSTSCARLCAT